MKRDNKIVKYSDVLRLFDTLSHHSFCSSCLGKKGSSKMFRKAMIKKSLKESSD